MGFRVEGKRLRLYERSVGLNPNIALPQSPTIKHIASALYRLLWLSGSLDSTLLVPSLALSGCARYPGTMQLPSPVIEIVSAEPLPNPVYPHSRRALQNAPREIERKQQRARERERERKRARENASKQWFRRTLCLVSWH